MATKQQEIKRSHQNITARSNDVGTFQETDIDEILAFHNELRRKFANGYFNVTASNMERL
ncbi:hypothetical protein CHS0354_013518, partial [Potamilus streckersoni]